MVGAQRAFCVDILKQSDLVMSVLKVLEGFQSPKIYLGAGSVYQTIWNYLNDLPLNHGIDDIDLIYFDSNVLEETQEQEFTTIIKSKLPSHFQHLSIDVKNQARVHLWYQEKFSDDIHSYTSVFDAVKSWPITAGSIIIDKNSNNNIDIFAPYGLSDLLSMTVRANKSQIRPDYYRQKCEKWQKRWPNLKIIPWKAEYSLDRIIPT